MEQQAKAPPEIRNVVSFLRSGSAGMKVRVGALNGKRIDYFKGSTIHLSRSLFILTLPKGKSAIKALLSPAYSKLKSVPKVTSESEAQTLLHSIVPYAFFLRVERGGPSGSSSFSPKLLSIIQAQAFTPSDYYAWFYEGSQWTTYAGGLLMVALMLGGVMFPLWPAVMRLGVWYLSIGMLGLIGLFFAIAIARLIFYILTVIVASPGIWIFPKLFADVGFVSIYTYILLVA
jgi:translocation protein SEC62